MAAAVLKMVLFLLINGYFPGGPVSRPFRDFNGKHSIILEIYLKKLRYFDARIDSYIKHRLHSSKPSASTFEGGGL